VHTGTKSLLVCDPAQQPIQLPPFFIIKSGANGIIVFACNTPDLFRRVLAGSCQMQGVSPPVCAILAAFDQATFLKFIQERNELAWQDGQATANLLLAKPGGESDQSENACVRTDQAQARQSFTKLSGSVGPYLRQQKGRRSTRLRLCIGLCPALFRHSCIVQ